MNSSQDLQLTTLKIPAMDCGAEENLIRLKLENDEKVKNLSFDLQGRILKIHHTSEPDELIRAIESLGMRVQLQGSEMVTDDPAKVDHKQQRKILLWVLSINFAFFGIEFITGWISGSMGLLADSLDMLADAFVYGLSLFAVGRTLSFKKKVASSAGYIQLALAIAGFAEVLRRFITSAAMPDPRIMIYVSVLALIANIFCLVLLRKGKGGEEAHMRASMIFTSNDIIINLGVIIAAVMVMLTTSVVPDLIIGAIVFVLVLNGARRIINLGK